MRFFNFSYWLLTLQRFLNLENQLALNLALNKEANAPRAPFYQSQFLPLLYVLPLVNNPKIYSLNSSFPQFPNNLIAKPLKESKLGEDEDALKCFVFRRRKK